MGMNVEYHRAYRQENKVKIAARESAHYVKNKPMISAYKKDYYLKNKAANWASALRKYGMTPAGYDDLLCQQNGRCAICQTVDPKGKGRFHIDHCHETGKNRGLLCHSCNIGLGHFRDSPIFLHSAAQYLLDRQLKWA